MGVRPHDHMHIVYGLRRQIRSQEKNYDYSKAMNSSKHRLRTFIIRRHELLKVLLHYQLVTFDCISQ